MLLFNIWMVGATHWNFWSLFVKILVNDLKKGWSSKSSSIGCKQIKLSIGGPGGCWLQKDSIRLGDFGELEVDRFLLLIDESVLSFLTCPFTTGWLGAVSHDDDDFNRKVNSTLFFLPFFTVFGWSPMKFCGLESNGDRSTRYHPLIGLKWIL